MGKTLHEPVLRSDYARRSKVAVLKKGRPLVIAAGARFYSINQ